MSVWIGMTGGLDKCWGEKGAASYRLYTGLLQSPHSYVLKPVTPALNYILWSSGSCGYVVKPVIEARRCCSVITSLFFIYPYFSFLSILLTDSTLTTLSGRPFQLFTAVTAGILSGF